MSRRRSRAERRGRSRDTDPHEIDEGLMETDMNEPENRETETETEKTMARRSTPLRQDVQRIGDDFRKLGSHAKELAADARDYARDRVARVPETARSYIQERPLQSMGIALGIGALLGLLLFRRGS